MLNFIVNRAAGNYSAKNTFKKVKTYLNKNKIVFRAFFGINREQIKEIVSRLEADKEDNIIVVGGDGTLHDVVNAISNLSKIKIGLIPAGKDNNFALSHGISLSPIMALQNVLNNEVVKLDLINIANVKAVNSVIVAGDYFLKERKAKFGQDKAYNINIVKIINKSRPFAASRVLNGKDLGETDVNAIVFANGTVVSNGLALALNTQNCDGKIDYLEFNRDKIKLSFKNKMLKAEEFEKIGAKQLTNAKITSGDENFSVVVDGEFIKNLPCEVSILKNTLLTFKPIENKKER